MQKIINSFDGLNKKKHYINYIKQHHKKQDYSQYSDVDHVNITQIVNQEREVKFHIKLGHCNNFKLLNSKKFDGIKSIKVMINGDICDNIDIDFIDVHFMNYYKEQCNDKFIVKHTYNDDIICLKCEYKREKKRENELFKEIAKIFYYDVAELIYGYIYEFEKNIIPINILNDPGIPYMCAYSVFLIFELCDNHNLENITISYDCYNNPLHKEFRFTGKAVLDNLNPLNKEVRFTEKVVLVNNITKNQLVPVYDKYLKCIAKDVSSLITYGIVIYSDIKYTGDIYVDLLGPNTEALKDLGCVNIKKTNVIHLKCLKSLKNINIYSFANELMSIDQTNEFCSGCNRMEIYFRQDKFANSNNNKEINVKVMLIQSNILRHDLCLCGWAFAT